MGDKPKNNPPIVEIDKTATVPLAYHELDKTRESRKFIRTVLAMAIGWAVSLMFVIGLSTYERLQYDYTSSNEAEGVYVYIDSDGNITASDLTADDIAHIMELLNDGDSETDETPH